MNTQRLITIREVDNRNVDDVLRWREAEVEALRREVRRVKTPHEIPKLDV